MDKQALIEAKWNGDEWPGIFKSTTGLLFLGTPFRGTGGLSVSEMLLRAERIYGDHQVQGAILNILTPGNETLLDLIDTFFKQTRQEDHKALIACFYELKASNVGRFVGGTQMEVSIY